MLRVTLEIVPFGQEAAKRTIGTIVIGNVGKAGKLLRRYRYTIAQIDELDKLSASNGTVLHLRPDSAWKLVEIILRDVLKKLSAKAGIQQGGRPYGQ